ncbi:LysE family translocator [Acinetobacter sp. MB5]|uniref:LysE family translocator n=1 Tax=Acinetobacter sp. MB5 TaxID=2069438 RepID=UPI000DCFA6A4|nr:LysE family translocator [Acinetobacter sp. MB5]
MMSWLFIGLVVTILFTPGPTNMLLASSGVRSGLKTSLQLIPAETLGYLIAITAWGIMIGYVEQHLPVLPKVLQLFSASYMFFLAIKLWKAAKQELDIQQPLVLPRELFIATLFNPKGLVFSSVIFPKMVWHSLSLYLFYIGIFILLIVPIALCWILLGRYLAQNKIAWLNPCNLQRTASVVLVSFSVPLSYSALIRLY